MTRKSLRFFLILTALLFGVVSFAFSQAVSVAITLGDIGNPFFFALAKGAEFQAKKDFGPATKVIMDNAQYDLGRQSTQIDNYIASGVKLLVLGAADSNGIGPAVLRAKAAGIVVVGVDVTAKNADLNITSNNVQAGQEAGEALVQKLGGKGDVIIVNGPPVSAVTDRVSGFLSVVSKYPDIHILSQDQNAGGSRDGGLQTMTNLLTAYPHIDAVFAINDPTAIGCNLAANQAGRNEFFIVAVDGSPDVLNQMKQPNNLIIGTAAQDPVMLGIKAVDLGKGIITKGMTGDGSTLLVPVKWITPDNMATFRGWTPPQK